MHRRLTLSALGAAFIMAACATSGLPVPTDVAITPPAPDLASELSAFSGSWEGLWGGQLPSRLIVERIDATFARVVYVWGAAPNGAFAAGSARYNARVLPGGKFEFGGASAAHFVFTMSQDRASVAGEREHQGRISLVTMRRVDR